MQDEVSVLPKDGNERYQLLLYVLSGYEQEEVQLEMRSSIISQRGGTERTNFETSDACSNSRSACVVGCSSVLRPVGIHWDTLPVAQLGSKLDI